MSRIVVDPAFASKLNDEQLSFVILHELMHCVLKHCTRSKGKFSLLYNIACDIVVNSALLEALDLSEMKITGVPAMHLTPKGTEGRFYSAEEVYEMLLEKVGDELCKKYALSSFDVHDVWEKIVTDSLLEGIWDNYTRNAARGVGKGSGIPGSVARMIKAIDRKPRISWQQVLHDYIQYNQGDYVFSSPDKRYSEEFVMPSFQEDVWGSKINNVWYVVDTSGSVNSDGIAEAFGEIKDAIEQIDNVEGFVSFFDCEITEPIPFNKVEDIEAMIPVGGGGTSFGVIFRYLSERLKESLPKVIIIITDGYASFPDEAVALGVPVIWLIVDSEVQPPFGEVLHVYVDE